MQKILDHLGLDYAVGVGEAAFYGPKLDIQIKNVHGKEDTLITIQIDQMLAEKFGMEYTDKDGAKKNPYIIHQHLHRLLRAHACAAHREIRGGIPAVACAGAGAHPADLRAAP